MARLIHKGVQYRTGDNQRVVSFVTDEFGDVDISEVDGNVRATLGFEDAPADEVREALDDVLEDEWSREHISEDAEATARDMLDKLEAQNEPEDESDAEDADDDNSGEPVHTMDDGTEICVGDRINTPGNNTYKITGRDGEHTLKKLDNTDDWGVTISKAEKDIREHGFDKRVEGSA